MKRQRGTGSIYKQRTSEIWWLKYYRQGRVLRESSGTADEAEARKLLKQRTAQVTTRTHPGLQIERVRVEELVPEFLRDYKIRGRKTLDDAETRWQLHLRPFFGGMKAVDVTSSHLAQYVDQRQQEGAANATINRELSALRRMFRLGEQSTPQRVLNVPHFPLLEENNTRQGFLEDSQYEKLVEGAELWFRTLVECGSTIGWRHQELVTLQVKQVDLEHHTLRLEPGTTKNKEGREAPMTDTMLQLLAACVEGKGHEDRVFTRPNGKPVRDFRDRWQKACCNACLGAMYCNQCGEQIANQKSPQCPGCGRRLTMDEQSYRGLLFHDLRRTAARNLVRAGNSEVEIKKIGGWKTTSMFERYTIIDQRMMKDAIHKLERYRREQAAVRRENGHTLGIPGNSEAENTPAKKLQ